MYTSGFTNNFQSAALIQYNSTHVLTYWELFARMPKKFVSFVGAQLDKK